MVVWTFQKDNLRQYAFFWIGKAKKRFFFTSCHTPVLVTGDRLETFQKIFLLMIFEIHLPRQMPPVIQQIFSALAFTLLALQ